MDSCTSKHETSDNPTLFEKVTQRKLVSIEYPGYINNVNSMLQSVGGEVALSENYYREKCRLQMTYRPEDMFSHYACADLTPAYGILIKVRRCKKKQVTQHSELDSHEIKQEIIGVINNEYQFKSLMDYQYIAPQNLTSLFENVHGSELGEKKVPPFFPPATFARIDTCGSYNYRPNPESYGVGKALLDKFDNKNLNENQNAPRKKRQSEALASLFHTENIPDKPTENSVQFINRLKETTDSTAVDTIGQLFEERPIWSKLALSCHVKVSFERLKKILSYFAYYWLGGPWRALWCRLGYDPRKDPNAKIYQMIEFRIRDSVKTKSLFSVIQTKRSSRNYLPRNLHVRPKGFSSSSLASSLQTDESKEDLTCESPYIFSSEKIPEARSAMYQLCDIHDIEVQKVVTSSEFVDTECKEKDGWYKSGTMAIIRQKMNESVINLLENKKIKEKGILNEDLESQDTEKFNNQAVENNEIPQSSTMSTAGPSSFDTFSFLELMQQDADDDFSYRENPWYQENYDDEYYDNL